jgi:hypothetical protein
MRRRFGFRADFCQFWVHTNAAGSPFGLFDSSRWLFLHNCRISPFDLSCAARVLLAMTTSIDGQRPPTLYIDKRLLL